MDTRQVMRKAAVRVPVGFAWIAAAVWLAVLPTDSAAQSYTATLQGVIQDHCCPRQDTPVAGAAENRRLGAAKWAASGGGLGFDVPQPVQVTAVPV